MGSTRTPVPLETQHATSSTARQEDFAVTRRRDTAERAHRAGDRRPVPQRGDDQRPGAPVARRRGIQHPSQSWVKRLLRGMRLSYKKPAKCVKELHGPGKQYVNTHRLFIKLCWQMSTWHQRRARREHRRDVLLVLPVHQIGWVTTASSKLSCRATRGRPRHSRSLSAWIVSAGHVGADRARGQDRRRLAGAALAGAHSSRHVRERRSCRSRPQWTTC